MASVDGTSRELSLFISYSRDDITFADQIDSALKVYGYATALDRHAISGGEEWKRRLSNLIREADTVLFVLSPDSATSTVCAWEVDEAYRLGKRIIPVVCRDLAGTQPPKQLADLNYIYFIPVSDLTDGGFGTGLSRLVEALNSDIDWLREHTRLLSRASEWETGGKTSNRLLSGNDVAAAKQWIANRPSNAASPTNLHIEFVRASEEEEARRQNANEKRLREIAEAQAAREAALAETEKAQKREAVASKRAVEEANRAAEASNRVARRTRIGLAVSLALLALSAVFGVYAMQQTLVAKEQRQRAITQKKLAVQASAAATISKKKAVEAAKKLAEANGSLETANRNLMEANALAEERRRDAVVASLKAQQAKQEAIQTADLLKKSNQELEQTNYKLKAALTLAESRRVAAEKSLDLMLQQLVIKATFESVRAGRPFRMSQVRAKSLDGDFQQALAFAPDPDEIWTRLARVLIQFATNAPHQLRGERMETQWARHAKLIMTRVVRRRRTAERRILLKRIENVIFNLSRR